MGLPLTQLRTARNLHRALLAYDTTDVTPKVRITTGIGLKVAGSLPLVTSA
jgi:hypothetical protein